VISLGVNLLRDVVKKPLSMGADKLILLEDPAFVDGDSWSTAYALAMAIKKNGPFDLIFADVRQPIPMPDRSVLPLRKFSAFQRHCCQKSGNCHGKVKVERVTADGFEVVEVATPALISVTNELPAKPVMHHQRHHGRQAQRTHRLEAADIGADASKIGATGIGSRMISFSSPRGKASARW